jgi:hypothetical protein
MRCLLSLLVAACVAGCATNRPVAKAPTNPPETKPTVREAVATRIVETRYDMRGYRNADDPNVRHDPHAIYRTTRVPAQVESLATVPRQTFAPASHAPLPQNAELSAELAAQREITGQLREIKARMALVEQQAQSQYGALVNQTADTVKLRQQLMEERARVRELEAKLHERTGEAVVAPAAVTASADPKW